MNVVYAFIGPLPSYSIETVKQTRLFYDGPLYFIISDLTSPLVATLETVYGVTVIPYESVTDLQFNECVIKSSKKFHIVHGLKGREKLFIYSFERFFVLQKLMNQRFLTNVLFLELDNLIYADPRTWKFGSCDMAYMFDNTGRCSSGIAFLQNATFLEEFCKYCLIYIQTATTFLSEMGALYDFWKIHPDQVQLLPVHWPLADQPQEACQTYPMFDSLFDAAPIGIYLCGQDPYHSGNTIVKGKRNPFSYHDFTKYNYEWKKDTLNRKIPYVWNDDKLIWIRINNLHVHSKDLAPYGSLNNTSV